MNCIIDKKDATKKPETKIVRCLQRLVKVRNWQDSYRYLHPSTLAYSRYYENTRAEGASRIDHCYNFGSLMVEDAKYVPVAFSDYFSLVVKFSVSDILATFICPKSRPSFRLRAEVIIDQVFKERLQQAMLRWDSVLMMSTGRKLEARSLESLVGGLTW